MSRNHNLCKGRPQDHVQITFLLNHVCTLIPRRGVTGGSSDELSSSFGASQAEGASAAAAPSSYALNLDMGLAEHTAEYSAAVETLAQDVFFQPEPTLLDIADGDRGGGGGDGPIAESVGQEAEFVIGTPPRWLPDEEAPACMGCQDAFTLFKRRHHCRWALGNGSTLPYRILHNTSKNNSLRKLNFSRGYSLSNPLILLHTLV